jgi:hypothetical protein
LYDLKAFYRPLAPICAPASKTAETYNPRRHSREGGNPLCSLKKMIWDLMPSERGYAIHN